MEDILQYLKSHRDVCGAVSDDPLFTQAWSSARDMLSHALKADRTIFIAGNGGSAADAQHFAAEIVGRFQKERRAYPALALTTDTSALTAIGNDYGFSKIFSRQIEGLGREGDVLVVLSTSGNSINLIHAAVVARQKKLQVIGLLGRDGGMLKEFVHVPLIVPSQVTAHIQELHEICYHAWCAALDTTLSG